MDRKSQVDVCLSNRIEIDYIDSFAVKEVEKEKLFAEKLNGRLAMLGIIAGLGAYLTTGQIIPGFV